ncbi:hypothetical protein MTR67_025958 [Solanum verrucosum]|uniref:DUF4216 domain-containing protein n=1 Tax=Solanum verrucosum TaxID=315347 RepID=A0AAF0TZK5_SOLVR|nr:hypothetical protein MTR67_025958 [Solanum verrucosum]
MNKYCVNGFKFQTEEVSRNKKTNNSSVYIQGDVDGTGQIIEYYGVIQEIIEVRYSGWPNKKIVLFRCEWFDPSHRGTKVDHQHNIIEVKHTRKYRSYDPFIIAQHTKQVYYASYPLRRDKVDWWVVIKSKPVGRIEIDNVLDVAYQNDVAIVQQQVDVELETTLQHLQHILEEVSDDEILNVEEEISENEENELFDDEEWDDNENETTEEEEWENDGSISSAPDRISHDTHLFVVPFGTADPRQYYPNYRRPVGASSTSQELPSRRYEDLPLQAIHRARPLSVGTPSPTSAPSATPHDTMSTLAPGQKDRLGRVMIELDGSSWHPTKDAARALKECVRRLYTQVYHSWSEIPNSIRQTMFNNFKYWNTYKFKAISDQAKMARGSLKGGSLHTGGAKTVGTIAREMNDFHKYVAENLDSSVQLAPELSTQIWKEKVVGGTLKGRCYGLGSRNNVRRLQSDLEGIGSSRQTEALDGVQIAAMSDQIAKLTVALAESEWKRVVEKQSMSETVQQIKRTSDEPRSSTYYFGSR